ncbi:MAG: hypothetical protein WAS33_04720, partial [Candidatus Promineifilaceae bacterium]
SITAVTTTTMLNTGASSSPDMGAAVPKLNKACHTITAKMLPPLDLPGDWRQHFGGDGVARLVQLGHRRAHVR